MAIIFHKCFKVKIHKKKKEIISNRIFIGVLIIIYFLFGFLIASGAYDNGTSTGKGKIQIDLTLNPFNYFEYGQSYIIVSYGFSEKFDLHAYYCDHGNYRNGVNSYYYGLFYQFLDTKYLDLSTAIGTRKMDHLNYNHIFFPQILYNLKLKNYYTIGGSVVSVIDSRDPILGKSSNNWVTVDIALFIPITKYFSKIKQINEIKLGLGTFLPGFDKDYFPKAMLPTYSIDIKFNQLFNK